MAQTTPILIHFSRKDIKRIDALVKKGFYASRTEAVRDAVRQKLDLLEKEEDVLENIADKRLDEMFKEYIEEDPQKRLRKLGL